MCKFCNISVNFENTKMVDNILKISRLGVFDTWRNCNYYVREKWIEDDIKLVKEFPCFLGHTVVYTNVVIFNKHSEKQNIIMKKMLDYTYWQYVYFKGLKCLALLKKNKRSKTKNILENIFNFFIGHIYWLYFMC